MIVNVTNSRASGKKIASCFWRAAPAVAATATATACFCCWWLYLLFFVLFHRIISCPSRQLHRVTEL